MCRTDGVLTMAAGTPSDDVTVCTVGALSLVAGCRTAGASVTAVLLIETTRNGSFAGAYLNSSGSFDANTAQPPIVGSVLDAPAGGPSVPPDGTRASFSAGAPDGSQLTGVGGIWADADSKSCRFVAAAIG